MKGELESLTDALWAEDFPALKNYLSGWQKAHPDADVYAWAEALNTSGTLMGVRFGQSHLSLSDLIHLLDQSAIDIAYMYKVPMDEGVLYCFLVQGDMPPVFELMYRKGYDLVFADGWTPKDSGAQDHAAYLQKYLGI